MLGFSTSGSVCQHTLHVSPEAPQAPRRLLRSEKGCEAPRASPPTPNISRAIASSGSRSCQGRVCSCQPSSVLLIKPNELHLTTAGHCHVASSRGCPSVGPGRPLVVQLEPSPIIKLGER